MSLFADFCGIYRIEDDFDGKFGESDEAKRQNELLNYMRSLES